MSDFELLTFLHVCKNEKGQTDDKKTRNILSKSKY